MLSTITTAIYQNESAYLLAYYKAVITAAAATATTTTTLTFRLTGFFSRFTPG